MTDMIPAAKVAAVALHHVAQASLCFPQRYHDTDKVAKVKVHLQVATELMALIADPLPTMTHLAEDGTVTPTYSPCQPVASAPDTPPPPKPKG